MGARKFEEGDWTDVYCGAKGIPKTGWSNLHIDIMHGALGVEQKMMSRSVNRPITTWCGTMLMHPAATRALRIDSINRDANVVMADVLPPRTRSRHIRRVLEASPFHGEGYRKAWAKLRVERIRTSQERVRRLMREHGLQAPYRAGHAHGPKAHDGTITTAAPNVMWGTDMTSTVTVGEGAACVFVAVDHCTAECIGLHAAKRGTRFEALEPIRQGVRERFGPIGDGVADGLRLRHDHGSNYLADDFQQEVAFFGIESSPSFVRAPEGNGVAERFIRTLKENLLWVRSFETIEDLRLALLAFKRTYNEQWMLAKYDYRSPAQVRRDFDGLDAAA